MASGDQYRMMANEIGDATLIDKVNQANKLWGNLNTNWYDELLRTAMIHNHSLDISGGTEKVTYSVGASYLYQDGILDAENSYNRLNLRTQATTGYLIG